MPAASKGQPGVSGRRLDSRHVPGNQRRGNGGFAETRLLLLTVSFWPNRDAQAPAATAPKRKVFDRAPGRLWRPTVLAQPYLRTRIVWILRKRFPVALHGLLRLTSFPVCLTEREVRTAGWIRLNL